LRIQEAPFQALLFGETLEEIMRQQRENEIKLAVESGKTSESARHSSVPNILLFLTDAVLKLNGCQTEGIFRVPGDIDMVNGTFSFNLCRCAVRDAELCYLIDALFEFFTDLRVRVEKGVYDLSGITGNFFLRF
jgi:hypothetical protein